jgi:CubicO group peptidase (beta-lactamase class C family)
MEAGMKKFVEGRVDASPSEASYDPAYISLLDSCYGGLVDSGRVRAAGYLMARGGKVFAHKACGALGFDAKDKAPYEPDSIKGIASITKIVTATAIMQLVERGAIWLEQPIATIIPEFDTAMHKGINVWNFLTHTSGLPADGGYWSEPYPIENHEVMRGKDWLKKGALAGPVQHRPGEQWNYCSIGFMVLAEIVSRASGMHYNDYVEEHIFKRIGMERSFIEVPKKLMPQVMRNAPWSEWMLKHASDRKGAPNGGGGAYSTLYDLFRLGQCFLNGGTIDGAKLLGRKTAQEMTRNQLEGVGSYHWGKNCKSYRQGLGWGFYCDGPTVGPATYNHEGWGWCSLFVDPVEKFVFVSMVNDDKEWSPDAMVKPRTIAFSGIE